MTFSALAQTREKLVPQDLDIAAEQDEISLELERAGWKKVLRMLTNFTKKFAVRSIADRSESKGHLLWLGGYIHSEKSCVKLDPKYVAKARKHSRSSSNFAHFRLRQTSDGGSDPDPQTYGACKDIKCAKVPLPDKIHISYPLSLIYQVLPSERNSHLQGS